MFKSKASTRNIAKFSAVILIMAIATLVIGCSKGFNTPVEGERPQTTSADSSVSQPTNGMVQSHDGGAVTIDMEWLGVENGSLVLNVAMNTHSVDLDNYDLSELAVLRDDAGNEYAATLWESEPGGHHRKGVLHFPVPPSLNDGSADYIEMVIHNIDEIDKRLLKWELR